MFLLSSNFSIGRKSINDLYQSVRHLSFRKEATQLAALAAFENINASFELAKKEDLPISVISFSQVLQLSDVLDAIGRKTLRSNSSYPVFNSPSKEKHLDHDQEIRSAIVSAKCHLGALSLNALNNVMKQLLFTLKNTARLTSSNIKFIVTEYSQNATYSDNAPEISKAICLNLRPLLVVLEQADHLFKGVFESTETENFNMQSWPEEEVNAILSTLQSYFTEFLSLSNSVAHFAEQNDWVRVKLRNVPKVDEEAKTDDFFSLQNYEAVLEFYKSQIDSCRQHVSKLIQSQPDDTIEILQVYRHLTEYSQERARYVQEVQKHRFELLEKHEEKLEFWRIQLKKLVEAEAHILKHYGCLTKMGIACAGNDKQLKSIQDQREMCLTNAAEYREEIKVAGRKVQFYEEICIEFDEEICKFMKIVDGDDDSETDAMIEFMEERSRYRAYMNPNHFDQPIYPPQEHWLLAPARPRNEMELDNLIEAFQQYDHAILELKSYLMANKDEKNVMHSLTNLYRRISSIKQS